MDYRVVTIDHVPAALDITTRPPRFTTQRKDAEVQVQGPRHDFQVDASAFREAMNLGDVQTESRKRRDEALEDGEAGTAETAREGDRMGRIEYGPAVPQLAAEELKTPYPEINVAPPPRISMRFSGTPGSVEVTPGDIRMKFQVAPPEVEYSAGEVQVDTEVRHINVSA
jgi:hypothetical protein